jgi:hypothetical protein
MPRTPRTSARLRHNSVRFRGQQDAPVIRVYSPRLFAMKKLLFLLGCLVVFAVIAIAAVSFFLGSIVKAGVNRFGPAYARAKVELADAQISLFTGSGTITGFLVGNPPGWQSDKAIYLGQAHLSMQPLSLLRDHIVINDILIDRPEFVYESRFPGSNLNDLLKNTQTSDGGSKNAAEPTKPKSGHSVRIEVKRFQLQNGKVTIGAGANAVTVPLPTLTLVDLGTKEGGIPADQLASIVMKDVLRQVLAAATGEVIKAGRSAGGAETVKKVEDSIKKLFGGGK